MGEQPSNSKGQRAALPWKAAAGTLGSGAVGAGGAFWLNGATPLQIAFFLAFWSLFALAGVTGYVARMWIERRVLHADELANIHRIYQQQIADLRLMYREQIVEIQAAARKREDELETDRTALRIDRDYLYSAVRESAHLTATAVTAVVQKGTKANGEDTGR